MTAIVASMMDSCGDYIAYARTMGYPMPPKHAVNRGIAVEGMATILCGINYNHFRRRSCNKLFFYFILPSQCKNIIISTNTISCKQQKTDKKIYSQERQSMTYGLCTLQLVDLSQL